MPRLAKVISKTFGKTKAATLLLAAQLFA
jgi:hypothetical protein